jgi:DnaJ domain
MIETLSEAQEYVVSAKRAGLYGELLQWVAKQRRGEYCTWPTCQSQQLQQQPYFSQQQPHYQQPHYQQPQTQYQNQNQNQSQSQSQRHATPVMRIADTQQPSASTTLARAPPPKRAMDYLHEAYDLLGIDDTKPLTHAMLKQAYKRAATKAHPDKGGSSEAFDAITRAFLYIQEILEKLIPKTAQDGSDPRFTAPVTPDEALKARGIVKQVGAAPKNAMKLEDAPPVALNPKKLDMNVFNRMFEEHQLPDPDKDDGYGDWLKSQEPARTQSASHASLKGKYNVDVFNKTFEQEAKRQTTQDTALSKYKPPSEMTLAPTFGTELGAGRPEHYTKVVGGAGIAYTDLKFAYGDGSTFSQEIADVNLDGRPKTLDEAKREYGTAPRALSADEAAAVSLFDQAKEAAEKQRQQRLAARDVDHSAVHERLQKRLLIQGGGKN